MSVEANKRIVRCTFEEIFNQGNLALVEMWVAATFVNHAAPAEMLPGQDALKGHVVLLRTAFPDLHFRVEELIADEERVAARVTFSGTHRGVQKSSEDNGARGNIDASRTPAHWATGASDANTAPHGRPGRPSDSPDKSGGQGLGLWSRAHGPIATEIEFS